MTDGPYKLPAGWRWVRLGEVACLFSGTWGNDPNEEITRDLQLARVIRVSDIKEDLAIGYDHVPLRSVKRSDVVRYRLRTGDIVVVKSSGSKAKVISGRAALFEARAQTFIPSNFTFGVRVREDLILPNFLWYWLSSPRAKAFVEQTVSTFTYPNLKKRDYSQHPIPLPPIEEQRRIVTRVEELMGRIREARRLREEAKKDADRLMQAALAEVFPRPGSPLLPGWRWVQLREVAKAANGHGFPKKHQGQKNLPVPFIKVSDLGRPGNDPVVMEAENYVDDALLTVLRARAYPAGTVVFPKIGGAIATNKKRRLGVRAAFDNNIMGLVPDVTHLSPDYLFHFVSALDLRTLAQEGPVPSIRQSAVESLPLPLPPLNEQQRIVTYLELVQGHAAAIKRAQDGTEADLQRLQQSILDRAFRGEL